jgi:hypothetical protein
VRADLSRHNDVQSRLSRAHEASKQDYWHQEKTNMTKRRLEAREKEASGWESFESRDSFLRGHLKDTRHTLNPHKVLKAIDKGYRSGLVTIRVRAPFTRSAEP